MPRAMKIAFFVTLCMAARTFGTVDSDADDRVLIPSAEVRSLIEVKETHQIALQVALRTTAGGSLGCVVGSVISTILTGNPALGVQTGCSMGTLLAGIATFAAAVHSQWSEQMRRAILAWEVWCRSHKHLRLVAGKDVKAAFRKCAVDVHPYKVARDSSREDKDFMRGMYHDCQFAGQFIKAFSGLYGPLTMNKKKDFFHTFAGKWAHMFVGESKMHLQGIDEYKRKARAEL
mmetsp:Transcript_158598/g.504729  ORF Transcript_158598/g.504729 Transcript_158598/m.504729 type:complete len:232 (+) Transcript_158598:103-798(+)